MPFPRLRTCSEIVSIRPGRFGPRLEQVFGTDGVADNFNNPDKAWVACGAPDSSTAVEYATALYDADIRYLQAIRKSLAKPR
jgi:hypothetical protein